MKKFKHKLTGKTATLEFDIRYYLIENECHIPSYLVENSNDWEEIIEKNYERLLYKGNILYNVKRLSDNQEFTIGDKVLNSRNELKTILGFVDTCNIQVELGTGNFVDYIDNLCNIQHYKEPILTTEDGYEMYEGDKVYFVEIGEYLHKGCEIVNSYKYNYILDKDFKFFKTKENAEKYIYENKPEFSRKQILEALDYAKYAEFSQGKWIIASKIKEKLKL